MKEEREFALKSVAELYSKAQASPATACFSRDGSTAELRILYEGFPIPVFVDLRASQVGFCLVLNYNLLVEKR